MKKNGKKYRRLQKEKAMRKANIIVGDGSKRREREANRVERENKKIHTCYHYFREKHEINRADILNYPIEEIEYEWMHILFKGIIQNYYYCPKVSAILRISAYECRCAICNKIFPIDKYFQMQELLKYINDTVECRVYSSEIEKSKMLCYVDNLIKSSRNKFYVEESDVRFLELISGVEPVKYCGIHNIEKTIVGVCDKCDEWAII